MHRHHSGSSPQLTFTSDFHQLVQGDLVPGPCVIRYDPLRIVDAQNAQVVDHHVSVFVRLHPSGVEWHGVLHLPAGLPLAERADPTSHRSHMLTATFEITAGTEELEVWFSCVHGDGAAQWDSNDGRNFWLRFALHDIADIEAEIARSADSAQDSLVLTVTSVLDVDEVDVRSRIASAPAGVRRITPMVLSATSATVKTWTTPPGGIPVASRASMVFDIDYRVSNRSFTDDNQGSWYVAS